MEPKIRDEQPTTATLELTVRPIVGLHSTREVVLSDAIYSVLSSTVLRHLHPRTLIQIVVQVLESGEDVNKYNALEMATAINAASTALIDAGIPMQGVPVAVVCALMGGGDDNDELKFDVTGEDLQSYAKSWHVVAYECKAGKAERLLLCESQGEFKKDQLLQLIDKSSDECEKVYNSLRNAVKSKVEQDFIWKN